MACALMARHIGGAVNYIAVTEALEVTPSITAAGLAADNLICAIYFTAVFALASADNRRAEKAAAENAKGKVGDGAGESCGVATNHSWRVTG